MKHLYFIYVIVFCSLVSCTNKTNPANSETYIPQIDNQWFEKGKPDHIFQLNTEDDGLSKGSITGTEDYPDSNFFGSELNGTFNNRHIEFNIIRPTGTIKFSGSFVLDSVMQMTSPSGPITIIHN